MRTASSPQASMRGISGGIGAGFDVIMHVDVEARMGAVLIGPALTGMASTSEEETSDIGVAILTRVVCSQRSS